MILAHEQDVTERYFFFSQGTNSVCKNEFVFQFTCLQPHYYTKIHAPSTHISILTRDDLNNEFFQIFAF